MHRAIRRWVTGVLSLGLVQGLAFADMGQPRTYALVIGINHYRSYPETPALPPLSYAEGDARKMAQALLDPKQGRVDRLRLLLEGEASKTAIEAELRDMARRVGVNDRLIFYYSGHGRPNRKGQASVMPYDAKLTDDETWLTLERIQALIQQALGGRGRYAMIVDACYSGQSLPGTRSFEVPGAKALPRVELPRPRWVGALLAASANTQLSWEDAELGGGVFTAYLLEAISGQADANGDGYVTLSEAYPYVARRVEAFTARKHLPQNPKRFGSADFALATNPATAARSRLAQLKLGGYISGEQFDALSQWVGQPGLPQDLGLYLQDHLTDGQMVELVAMGAIPNVPPSSPADPRLLKVAGLRKVGRITLSQLWILSGMIKVGKAPWLLRQFLAGRVREERFLQGLAAGQVGGVSP
ncbi:MAG: caspase family protein [Deinococcota bacterium]